MIDVQLLLASKRALTLLKGELFAILEGNSLLDKHLQPIPGTLDPDAQPWVDEYQESIAQLEAAIAEAEGKDAA